MSEADGPHSTARPPDQLRVAMTLEQCWHDVPGGTAMAALRLAAALSARTDVTVVGVAASHRSLPQRDYRPSIPVRQLPLPRRVMYPSWQRLRWPLVERYTGTVEVVHATAFPVPPRSAPLVVTVHDLEFLHRPDRVTRHGARFFRRAWRLVQRDADRVIVPSEFVRAACLAAGLGGDRVRVVPHGVAVPPVTTADVESARTRYDLHRPYVLWVGTWEPRKNLDGLLTAFTAVDAGVDLCLVGPPGWRLDATRLPALGDPRVHRLGFVSEPDLHALYAGASVFCLPSHGEGFGLTITEAMAHGTPVITSAGSATEEVADGAALLIDPSDPTTIADAIGRVMSEPTLAHQLSEAGRRRTAGLTWDKAAERTIAVYREAAS
jgi:glycosyltransferase involved in cell wall biosynthesis